MPPARSGSTIRKSPPTMEPIEIWSAAAISGELTTSGEESPKAPAIVEFLRAPGPEDTLRRDALAPLDRLRDPRPARRRLVRARVLEQLGRHDDDRRDDSLERVVGDHGERERERDRHRHRRERRRRKRRH